MEKVTSLHTRALHSALPCPALPCRHHPPTPTPTLDSHTRTGKHACLAGGPGDRGVGRQRGSLAGCDLGDGYAFHRACGADGCATAVQVRQPPVCHTVLHLACCAFLVVCCAQHVTARMACRSIKLGHFRQGLLPRLSCRLRCCVLHPTWCVLHVLQRACFNVRVPCNVQALQGDRRDGSRAHRRADA